MKAKQTEQSEHGAPTGEVDEITASSATISSRSLSEPMNTTKAQRTRLVSIIDYDETTHETRVLSPTPPSSPANRQRISSVVQFTEEEHRAISFKIYYLDVKYTLYLLVHPITFQAGDESEKKAKAPNLKPRRSKSIMDLEDKVEVKYFNTNYTVFDIFICPTTGKRHVTKFTQRCHKYRSANN